MSVLVTGGAGYIGSHAVIDLLRVEARRWSLSTASTGFDWAIQDAAALHTGDVGDHY